MDPPCQVAKLRQFAVQRLGSREQLLVLFEGCLPQTEQAHPEEKDLVQVLVERQEPGRTGLMNHPVGWDISHESVSRYHIWSKSFVSHQVQ